MAVKSKDDILSAIRSRFPDDSSDEVLELIEDVTDTFDDLENRAKPDGKDWEAEAKRIDTEWREKYKARFFSGGNDHIDEEEMTDDDTIKKYNYEDLFSKE